MILNSILRLNTAIFTSNIVDNYLTGEHAAENLAQHKDSFLFSGTIKDNIRYGKLDATEEEIVKASKVVYIDDGGVKECGTHDELIEKRGAYYKLYMSQSV